ncbi:Helix-loop-helix DNA-binding domain protein [Dictyocaulus viviparus]|uniref:Helix-loop-helix DNA-binding domain protein n=1 Tax=Dictyocaulus viviparus TaxID=29172 RepID=A0A0D8Y3M1_DICVI|nr:Helix-loop-helix DNA-binding domain protein [Dictyocaulus viviparus]
MLCCILQEEKLFSVSKHVWTSQLSSSAVASSNVIGSDQVQIRSAPPTAEIRSSGDTNPWKLSDLGSTEIYAQPSYGLRLHDNDDSVQSSSSLNHMNMEVDTNDKSELKDERVLMSAPSSVKSVRGCSRQVQADSTLHPEERKRILHLHAEQNRRSALKDGFDMLMDMIPDLHSGGVKPTNAVVLAKGAEHIRYLTALKSEQSSQRAALIEKIARLNRRIGALQSNLPSSTGATSTKLEPRAALEAFYDRYTKERSRKDYRFWVLAQMLRPIAVGEPSSFSAMIAPEGSSREEIAASCSEWLNCHWRAAELRPLASTLLVHLATTAGVLTNPERLEEHVREQLNNPLA